MGRGTLGFGLVAIVALACGDGGQPEPVVPDAMALAIDAMRVCRLVASDPADGAVDVDPQRPLVLEFEFCDIAEVLNGGLTITVDGEPLEDGFVATISVDNPNIATLEIGSWPAGAAIECTLVELGETISFTVAETS